MKRASFFIVILLAVAGITLLATAQTPIAVRYTATTDNVGMSDSIRVELFRWSTDKEREQLLDAWKVTAAPPPPPAPAPPVPETAAAPPDAGGDTGIAPAAGRGGAPARGAGANAAGGGRGARGNARGGAAPAVAAPPVPEPAAAPDAAAPARGAPANAAGGGRGGAARGNARGGAAPARGAAGGRGARGDAAPAAANAALTPEGSLSAALGKAETVGRIWSSESAGYSVRYAVRLPQQDGGERIVLITDRRLNPDIWKPASGAATSYEFTVIEARLNSKGAGEARASLTGKVTVDAAAGVLALENYAAVPVILKNVQRQ